MNPNITHRGTRGRGFSIIEALILIAAALVVAGLSVPVLRGITLSTNTESAIETLARVREFQIRYFEKGASTHAGGAARFGTFDELLRSGLGLEDSAVRDRGMILVRHGYYFQQFFISRSGDPVADPRDPSVDPAKNRFFVYAWPEERGRTGASTFIMDPSGYLRSSGVTGLFESKNLLNRYSGLSNAPKWSAARSLALGGAKTASVASNPAKLNYSDRGEDGEIWESTPVLLHD
ncbi:MAG: Tfp pilus assembly protein FimT/FimU [Planctomycetota bacterium]